MFCDPLLEQVELKFKDNSFKVFKYKDVEHVEENEMTKVNNEDIGYLHNQICKELNDICVRKNKDYKNSFSDTWKEFGLISLVIRMNDKMLRIKQLSKNDASVKDESIKDTLLDMANYCILGLIELNKESDKNEE